jgi:hypothetical protein
MATKKRRVTKSASKKKAPTKKAPAKTNRRKAPTEKAAPKAGLTLVDPKTLKQRPRPRRPSKFDEVAKTLLANPGKATIIKLPEGKKPEVYRTMLYTRISKCISHFKPKHGMKVSIYILHNNDLGVSLVKA